VVLAVINLTPFNIGFMVNDGMVIRLFKNDAASKHCAYYLHKRTFAIISGKSDLSGIADVPDILPKGNRLADTVRLSLAEDEMRMGRFGDAERRLSELLDEIEDEKAANILNLFRLLCLAMDGAEKGAIDEIFEGKTKKFVLAYGRTGLEGMLFLAAYEKRFCTGTVNIDDVVRRFEKAVGKIGIDTTFEKELMASILAFPETDGAETGP
jgi:hypothetical protein